MSPFTPFENGGPKLSRVFPRVAVYSTPILHTRARVHYRSKVVWKQLLPHEFVKNICSQFPLASAFRRGEKLIRFYFIVLRYNS